MKLILTLSFALLTSMASRLALAAPIATYQCGAKQVTVSKDGDSYMIQIVYVATDVKTAKQHKVHIASEPITFQAAGETFSAEQSMAGKALKTLTALPEGSVAFAGFHFPNGKMYVIEEGDTNEQGYFFAASPDLLAGAATADASEIFWSYFDDAKVAGGNCSRLY